MDNKKFILFGHETVSHICFQKPPENAFANSFKIVLRK